MKDNIFFDTNIWIYLFSDEKQKQDIVRNILENNFGSVVISTQVLNEIFFVMTKKKISSTQKAEEIIRNLSCSFTTIDITAPLVLDAIKIFKKYKFSYWDSLIVAACSESGCNILYSEDFQNGQIVNNKVRIINPFI